jgi:hypothetical protein
MAFNATVAITLLFFYGRAEQALSLIPISGALARAALRLRVPPAIATSVLFPLEQQQQPLGPIACKTMMAAWPAIFQRIRHWNVVPVTAARL